MVIIHPNLVIKMDERSKEICVSPIMAQLETYFWKNSWSRLDSYPLWGNSSTINLVSFMVGFFLSN